MKKIIVVILAGIGIFYAYGRYAFAENRVCQWLSNQSMLAITSSEKACEAYADSMDVDLTAITAQGVSKIQGGKAELCGYLEKSTAAMSILHPSISTHIDDVVVKRSGFPWLTAEVTYTEEAQISIQGLPPFKSISEDTVTLKRTWSGLKITKMYSFGKVKTD